MARCNAGAAVSQVGENPSRAASKACGEKLSQQWMEEPTASADNAPAIRPCTWCNGIGVKQMSSGTSSNTEAMATVAVMTLAWLSPTSLGSAVVPDVRISMAGAFSPCRRCEARGRRPSIARRPGQVLTQQSVRDAFQTKADTGNACSTRGGERHRIRFHGQQNIRSERDEGVGELMTGELRIEGTAGANLDCGKKSEQASRAARCCEGDPRMRDVDQRSHRLRKPIDDVEHFTKGAVLLRRHPNGGRMAALGEVAAQNVTYGLVWRRVRGNALMPLARSGGAQEVQKAFHSAALEAGRLPLLDMRGDRLAKVLSQIELHRICEGYGHAFRLIHEPAAQANGGLHAQGRICRDALRQRPRVLNDAALRSSAADEARLECLLGAEEPARERDFRGGGASPAIVEQAPKPRSAQTTWCLGDLEARGRSRNDEIAFERHTQTQTHDGAVHRRDHRLPVD